MGNTEKTLKLLQNQNISKEGKETPTLPLMQRAPKLKNLESAQRLISKATSDYLKGRISEQTFKSIVYGSQVFSGVYKDFLLEKGITDYLYLRFALYNFDVSRALDSFLESIKQNVKIDEKQLEKIGNDFRNRYIINNEERRKRSQKILEELEKEKGIKIKLITENDVDQLKQLILLAIRSLPENEKYSFIENEIRTEFYNDEE
jgi:peptide methionine sulfoxide reductase MsrA